MKITRNSHLMVNTASLPAIRTGATAIFLAVVLPIPSLLADSAKYPMQNLTGSLTRVGSMNVSELANTSTAATAATRGPEANPYRRPVLRPPVRDTGVVPDRVASTPLAAAVNASASFDFRGFNGLTHLDQRLARGGNQFSTEPPDQGLAVGNGFVLEAVNSALNIYDTDGVQRLLRPLALSQFFGLREGINRTTGFRGVFPGDPSAIYDPETERWFVVAFAQLNKSEGTPLPQTRVFIGVSQTSDPTAGFTIFTLNTTGAKDPDGAGPRLPDFPHIGVDHYGLYISTNEFTLDPITASPGGFISAALTAISKQALITGIGGAPTVARFVLPFESGYEFTVFPAYTAPGTSPVLTNGGAQFFVSSRFVNNTEHSLAVWALTNTKSLDTTTPNLDLQAVAVETQAYHFPSVNSIQKRGFHPLGTSLGEPVEKLDSGDFRVISVCYSNGKLWTTLGSEIRNSQGLKRMAADYFALSPNLVGKFLTARVITQGVVAGGDANLLRPAIAVNARGKGGMVFTLVGPNDFPSSAFVPINGSNTGNAAGPIQISRAGNEPEDGFTGYVGFGGNGVARWGDYSAAAVDDDGSIWMATEYVPDLARTSLANWSTYITRYAP